MAGTFHSSGTLLGNTTQLGTTGQIEYHPPKAYVQEQFAAQGLDCCVQIQNHPKESDFVDWLWANNITAWSRVHYSDGVALFGFNDCVVAFDFKIRFG